MKIVADKYPQEKDIDKWLGFIKNGNCNIVFLWRYSAYCRDIIKSKNVAYSGFRTHEEQKTLYDLYLSGKGNQASKPYTSWHEYGFAIDLNRYRTNADGSGQYYGTINADYLLWLQGKPTTLSKYGLTHTVKGEPWHIQPIETKSYTGLRQFFADADDYPRDVYEDKEHGMLYRGCPDGEAVKEWQESLVKCSIKMIGDDGKEYLPDGSFGSASENGTNLFKKSVGLPQDGKVDEITYGKMLNKLQNMVITVNTGITQARLDTEIAKVTALQSANSILSNKIIALEPYKNDLITLVKIIDKY